MKKIYLKGHVGEKKFKIELPRPKVNPIFKILGRMKDKEAVEHD